VPLFFGKMVRQNGATPGTQWRTEDRMPPPNRPTQHPHRVMLHNEIHARPPEALTAPLAIAHIVMLADAAGREASRAHVAALLRDHHLALPDAQTTHLRMDLGVFRIRWELHTEFVSWTFMVPTPVEAFGERDPTSAIDAVPREWLAALPGQCLCSLNLWVLPTHQFGSGSLVKHVLHEDTLVASTVADGHGELYTDFAIHADGFSRMVLLAGGMTPRRLGRLVQRLLEIETYRMAACWACLQPAMPPMCWPLPSASWPSWPSHPHRQPRCRTCAARPAHPAGRAGGEPVRGHALAVFGQQRLL
jgi:Uncharacterized membrane-anchored protein conserved in bacteria